jgi:hypothetical protein
MTTHIFVGPTLPASAISDAVIHPPVAVGDVLTLIERRGVTRIAIIDGYFERMAAVWHKEILHALERGIAVYGAASMGALRAAELHRFGMIGVGAIFQAFRRGTLVADDEVAVAHLPAEYGYRATSDALVNLRDGLSRAPMLTAKTRDTLIELARARFYRDRSWHALIDDGRAAGLPVRQLDALEAWPKPDRKAADARLLLRALNKPPRKPPRNRVPRTWALRQLADWLA